MGICTSAKEKSNQDNINKNKNFQTTQTFTINNNQLDENLTFRKDCLKEHNILRKRHKVNDLILSEELNRIAQKNAQKIANEQQIGNSVNKWNGHDLGESVYISEGNLTAKSMVQHWYEEGNNYCYDIEDNFGTSHFTQIIWKETEQIGVGIAKSRDGKYSYGVVIYYPEGNYGYFKENVLRP